MAQKRRKFSLHFFKNFSASGRVDLQIKKDIDLSLRIPRWTDLKQVNVTVDEKPIQITVGGPHTGRYAQIGKVKAGSFVKVMFPIRETTEVVRLNMYVHQTYLVTLRGATVIDVAPKGKFCPWYQRDYYKNNQTKYHEAKRFISDATLQY